MLSSCAHGNAWAGVGQECVCHHPFTCSQPQRRLARPLPVARCQAGLPTSADAQQHAAEHGSGARASRRHLGAGLAGAAGLALLQQAPVRCWLQPRLTSSLSQCNSLVLVLRCPLVSVRAAEAQVCLSTALAHMLSQQAPGKGGSDGGRSDAAALPRAAGSKSGGPVRGRARLHDAVAARAGALPAQGAGPALCRPAAEQHVRRRGQPRLHSHGARWPDVISPGLQAARTGASTCAAHLCLCRAPHCLWLRPHRQFAGVTRRLAALWCTCTCHSSLLHTLRVLVSAVRTCVGPTGRAYRACRSASAPDRPWLPRRMSSRCGSGS